ncbi:uncharacterized protein LOC129730839 [Wyeomyia smithii]|uniref:uncharacterized protein LOC129730839 n=1 Tax=Wyeomyia smithii TaxID=174621 RepID=UPI002467E8FE|nr:uncharacterized protein LOC129730839 [Wyeomyia smithii]
MKHFDSETLSIMPRKIRFNLFHRPKEIVGSHTKNRNADGAQMLKMHKTVPKSCSEIRPKVNLFPQISLHDLTKKDQDNVIEYMYSSDWKEASRFTSSVSYTSLTPKPALDKVDTKFPFFDRYKRKKQTGQYFDLPVYEVDLSKWYK